VAIYLAAVLIVAAVALFVAAPLSAGFPRRRRSTSLELELEGLEHNRGLAVQGLRELEFDHEMGKLDQADYHALKRSLEDRALAAMSAIERLRDESRASTMRLATRRARAAGAPPASSSPAAQASTRSSAAVADGSKPGVKFCPQCGARVGAGYNFCAECGAKLGAAAALTASRAE
jgi:hypothetical protein